MKDILMCYQQYFKGQSPFGEQCDKNQEQLKLQILLVRLIPYLDIKPKAIISNLEGNPKKHIHHYTI